MSKAIIIDWILSGCDVQQGIQLYAELSSNKQFLRLCQLQPKKYASKLIAQLRLIGGISVKEFKQLQKEGSNTVAPRTLDVVKVENREIREVVEQKDPEPKVKMREDFPFLSDPTCPHELQLLIGKKITAYHNYVQAHKDLFDCTSLEQCAEVAEKLIENYQENRQIFEELDYYKEHKNCLGLHPIFKLRKQFKDLQGMNVRELIKLHDKTIPHRIWRIQSEIGKGDKPHLDAKRQQSINDNQAQLAEVKRILGL